MISCNAGPVGPCEVHLQSQRAWAHEARIAAGSLAESLPSCAGLVRPDETVAVVGSSHSAVLVLMNLLEMEDGPKVVNLYRSPLRYAKFVDGGPPKGYIVLDNTGLKVCNLLPESMCLPTLVAAGLAEHDALLHAPLINACHTDIATPS